MDVSRVHADGRMRRMPALTDVRIDRVDPLELDLDTADEMAAVGYAIRDADGVRASTPSGPTRLKLYQHGSDGTPAGGVWLAREGARLVGIASAYYPTRENTDSAGVSGGVHPDHRGRGVGRALLETVREAAAAEGRTKIYSGTMQGTAGEAAVAGLGFEAIHTYAISHLDLHDADRARWDRLHADAAAAASHYELVRIVGRTPEQQLDDVVALFAAINDAPMTDPDAEPDAWDAARVRAYDEAMQSRRQTVYRVMARHRASGSWAGHTVFCIDEFDPEVGHQEDTSVVTAHRGHRLGLLLKTEMLRWMADERPEVRISETWNSVENHHMLAVNEALGTRVVDRHLSLRLTAS
jgi:GNAT superfamily N-acetyltransferase